MEHAPWHKVDLASAPWRCMQETPWRQQRRCHNEDEEKSCQFAKASENDEELPKPKQAKTTKISCHMWQWELCSEDEEKRSQSEDNELPMQSKQIAVTEQRVAKFKQDKTQPKRRRETEMMRREIDDDAKPTNERTTETLLKIDDDAKPTNELTTETLLMIEDATPTNERTTEMGFETDTGEDDDNTFGAKIAALQQRIENADFVNDDQESTSESSSEEIVRIVRYRGSVIEAIHRYRLKQYSACRGNCV